jgi:L-alanine-DL-glutamate epimerase-like enolase superfamily enzyme
MWDVPTALRVARNLEQYGFFNIEQPCNSYEECLRVRRHTRLTTAIDESVTDFDVLFKAARDDAADIIHIKLSRIGGITRARQMRDFCTVAGLSISWASSGGTEISDAAATHVACSTPAANLFGLWSCREFNTERFGSGGPVTSNGRATVPDMPGLGVDPFPDKLGAPLAVFEQRASA